MQSGDLQAVMDAAVDAVVLIGNDGLITGFNRAAEQLFGYARAEVVGRNVTLLMPKSYAARHDEYLQRYARTGIPHIVGVGRDVEARRRDGSVFPAFLSVGRISDTQPPGFVGFVRDVTAERQVFANLQQERDRAKTSFIEEQEARRLQEQLMHVSRMATMGEMAAGVAHELNQPLSAIATYARACQRLVDAGATDDPDFRASLREIEEEAFRAGKIIRQLRQLTNPGAAARELTDLNALVLDVVALVQADARLHQIGITTEMAPGPIMATVDRVHIQQVALHLLRNAVEALGGVGDRSRLIHVTTRMSGTGFELSVADNGPDLAPMIRERLFLPFFTTKPTGAGLGLVTSRTIVEAHGGTLAYQPSDMAGARFAFTLPLNEVSG
jgi:two-component system sensor kinase FixL